MPATWAGRSWRPRLPDIADFCRTYLGVDPAVEPMPVQPTAHYAMGGIPTDMDARVVIDEENKPLPGFYAAGECACVSVHGANRLGTNSLVDIVVFGRRAGRDMARFMAENDFVPLPDEPDCDACDEVERLLSSTGSESAADIRRELETVMMDNVGVFRIEAQMQAAVDKVHELQERFRQVGLQDKGSAFQHRASGGHRTGLPARPGRGHGRKRPGPQGEPGRPLAGGLSRTGRRELAKAHAGLPHRKRGGTEIQAGVHHPL